MKHRNFSKVLSKSLCRKTLAHSFYLYWATATNQEFYKTFQRGNDDFKTNLLRRECNGYTQRCQIKWTKNTAVLGFPSFRQIRVLATDQAIKIRGKPIRYMRGGCAQTERTESISIHPGCSLTPLPWLAKCSSLSNFTSCGWRFYKLKKITPL